MNSFEDFTSNLSVDDIEALDDEDNLIEALLLNDEDEDEYMWNEMITSIIHQSNVMKQVPQPCRTRQFSGHMLVEDMLAGHPDRSYSCFRMSSETILLLKNVLIEKNALRPTRYLSCNEQLCIFLYGISHALSNRVLAEIFQHSGETISRHYNNVLNAILSLKQDYIQLPTADVDVHPKIRENPNFFPYFKKALGAIDGSHIPVIVKKKKHNRYRNRKNFISQNVMAACSFDHTFLYVAAGWEGSASDMSVLRATLEDGKFNVPEATGKGKLSEETSFKNGKSTKHGESNTITYHVLLHIEPEFGVPGAIVVKNGDQNEFFLKFVTVEGEDGGSIYFNCNSWVYPVKKTSVDRLFFSNTSYLPSETPEALRSLRQEELASLRGNGSGERKAWDRIYDYDRYNDLGAPDKGEDHVRPVLGGSRAYPYPRRGRTGRPLSIDRMTETRHKLINLDFYVPPDERFSPSKLSEFITDSLQAILHFVIPEVKSLFQGDHGNFESFEQVTKDLYAGKRSYILEGKVMDKLKSFLPEELFKEVLRMTKGNPVKFPVPQVIAADEYAWKTDEEFAREMLAGLNPVMIKRLETFPPIGKGGKRSSITILDIRKSIGRVTVQQLMNQRRIFILDHHDYLMPYLKRINEQKDVCVYASRTLLLLKLDGSLKPLAIELSLPGEEEGEEINRVFLPATEGTDAALWQLAKAHVAVNDSGYHQLITHWLHTHAAVEPFVIATRRQLSAMHPIHKLLHPHFKDTMHINSLARSILLNSGGILEMTMFPGKFSMELSSKIYENWRFDEQGLPADLLKRGLAVEDREEPSGIRLRIKDYPYAVDGLDIWSAITTYISSYCSLFYPSDASVVSDVELQSWWTEIRQVGHGDSPASSWPNLDSLQNLTTSLTTIVWIASALHASVNFGQYAYAGFLPNRPTKCRRFIPAEGTPEFAEFLKDPDRFFLRMLTDRFTATLGIALIEVLSRHTGDEVYLGRRDDGEWTNDEEVKRVFLEFGEELRRVEKKIEERNSNMLLKNRRGLVNVPYMLMYPDTANVGGEKGLTGRGIPNSVSI